MSDEADQYSSPSAGQQALLTTTTTLDVCLTSFTLRKHTSIVFQADSRDLAVCVEGAWKNYGYWWKSMTALHDVTLRVPRGVM